MTTLEGHREEHSDVAISWRTVNGNEIASPALAMTIDVGHREEHRTEAISGIPESALQR
jgi:hypothetical protein